MRIFDAGSCPIQLDWIDTSSAGNESFAGAFSDDNYCKAAYVVIRMLQERGGVFRPFTLSEFLAFCKSRKMFPWEANPAHRKGFERLLRDGFIADMQDGRLFPSLELVTRCLGVSPQRNVINTRYMARAGESKASPGLSVPRPHTAGPAKGSEWGPTEGGWSGQRGGWSRTAG